MTRFPKLACALGALALATALAACTSAGPAPASSSNALEVTQAHRGAPLARYSLPSGERLFYQLRPGERERLDFDASGALIARVRMPSREQFAALAKNGGNAVAVQLAFGPPNRKAVLDDGGGLQWTYSWLEYGVWRLAHVWFDKAGSLQRVELVEDPLTDDRYR